ncbi:transcriptional repressor TraM [Rhizobium calliandrae]|uniref:Transcriptional repressor TraM n=1 Tax=Rhizobium calliandrae TaxID=1312182 RepID=A0ABT7KK81_9HYPH|nr:transcriptional repressor TraM [Rhizobium calliandrae]MDL2407629.1 transcriptional repressor TraM [Rhizobium calliandrae]
MDNEVSFGTSGERASRYRAMRESDLKALAISAIREHRRLLAADEAVYEEWTLAAANASISSDVLKRLQDEYVERQKKSEAQQEELSEIIDVLGYIPDVPSEDDE